MKLMSSAALLLAVALVGGCGEKSAPASEPSNKATAKALTVGIVFDKGGLGDKSFNDSAWAGIQRAKKDFGIQVFDRASPEESDYQTNLQSLADKNADLIIGVGINMETAVNNAAKENPNVKFAIVDGSGSGENVRSLKFNEEQGSFLAGYLAGLTTKSGKVGFVGGMEIPLIKKFYAGYVAGVKTANPAAEVLPAKYTGSWNDTGLGKLAAQALYGGGADIVFHAAGRCGLGVFEAAKESGKYAIGVDSDQDAEQPGLILTSMIKRVDEAVYQTIKDVRDGAFTPGDKVYDLKANGVGLSEMKFTKATIGEAALKKIGEARQKIISGEIVVPTDDSSLAKYLAGLKK